jgi:adenosylhomocysteinase
MTGTTLSQAEVLRQELAGFKFCFPIMEKLGQFLLESNHLKGKRVGWHCHLTTITAATVEALLATGAELFLSECSPHTTSSAAVDYMRNLGARVHLGELGVEQVLDQKPLLASDTGLALIGAAITGQVDCLYAGSEITTSGITQLRTLPAVPIAVLNINDGQLKTGIENFHGVGDGVIEALFQLTGRLWTGRPAAVVGYGRVGAGTAHYLRTAGAVVTVVESDPVRRLIAHYDGFSTGSLPQALLQSELLVTCTGQPSVVPESDWMNARDGLIVLNVGHVSDEVDSLKRAAKKAAPFSEHLERFTLAQGDVFLATQGSPANVVMLTGSPEPTLIHLTAEILALNYLAGCFDRGTKLIPGEHKLPADVERQASLLALAALGLN